jgi:hypothetical protein
MAAHGSGTTELDVCHGFELLGVQTMFFLVILTVRADDVG